MTEEEAALDPEERRYFVDQFRPACWTQFDLAARLAARAACHNDLACHMQPAICSLPYDNHTAEIPGAMTVPRLAARRMLPRRSAPCLCQPLAMLVLSQACSFFRTSRPRGDATARATC